MHNLEAVAYPAVAGVAAKTCQVVVIWIDWYAYHLARFRALHENPVLAGHVVGVEMVGGVGVHEGLKFREDSTGSLPIQTLFPGSNWREMKGLKLASAVWSRLNQLNPSVVLVPGYYTAPGIASALWGKLKGRRTVLMTESAEQDHERVWWKEFVKGVIVRSLFDWAITGGTSHRRYLDKLGFPASRVARFYDVVDNDFFAERSMALRSQATPPDFGLPQNYFLYVGRLAPEKNIEILVEAYLQYRRAGGTWSLVLVGDGPSTQLLREKAVASGFESDIHFTGLKSTAELPTYYSFASCFVLPSTREPWGLVTNEAMASGLPLLLSERCGCVEDLLIEGENGFTFDPTDVAQIASRLSSISKASPVTLAAMGQRSSELIDQFSPKGWASEVARIANA